MADIYRAAEELETVVGTHESLNVIYCSSATDAVECDTVRFLVFAEGIAGVFHTDVFQNAGIVVSTVASVCGVTDF